MFCFRCFICNYADTFSQSGHFFDAVPKLLERSTIAQGNRGSLAFMRVFERGLRAPRIHSRIQNLQPHLPFVLRSWCADPHHVAPRNIQWVFVWDDLDNLSAFQSESPHESEPSGELSSMRQGSLFAIRSRLTTRLALFFRTIRFDRRFL